MLDAKDNQSGDISGLHHVGHVFRDLGEGLALYRRLGFFVPPATYPMLSRSVGQPPAPFGLANTHVEFPRAFVELLTCVGDGADAALPPDAQGVPMHPPDISAEKLAELRAAVAKVAGAIEARLARREGVHILVFHSANVDGVSARLTAAGVEHAPPLSARRTIRTRDGVKAGPVRFLALSGDPDVVPEGRLAFADLPADELLDAQMGLVHPNGALALVEVIVAVPDAQLAATALRYERLLGRAPRDSDATRIFELSQSRVIVAGEIGLQRLLPGATVPSTATIVGYTVAVADLAVTKALLATNGLAVTTNAGGDLVVPATVAQGVAVGFRQRA